MTHDDRPDEHPHDVLAAEEFSVPAEDPALRVHGPIVVPEPPFAAADPPHDVLAAEEFAVPAGRRGAGARTTAASAMSPARRGRLLAAVAGVGALVTIASRRRR